MKKQISPTAAIVVILVVIVVVVAVGYLMTKKGTPAVDPEDDAGMMIPPEQGAENEGAAGPTGGADLGAGAETGAGG